MGRSPFVVLKNCKNKLICREMQITAMGKNENLRFINEGNSETIYMWWMLEFAETGSIVGLGILLY
ncbi:MAG: hypothetical protein LBR09_02245 [Endomicrobium sp.]|jgi:hypothetical protein|nr:hypothetical protein [Endomicrobium sp.]